ncbi:MAG: PorP/SprF family type IX secretion system membrane protein [Bacteroidota bacterium]
MKSQYQQHIKQFKTSKKIIFSFYLLILVIPCHAQDIQLTQYYNIAQSHNPAFVGTSYAFRAVLDGRFQWPALDAKYKTYYFSADYNLERYNSGFGGYFISDYQGSGNIIRKTKIALQYASWININDEYSLRLGIEGAYNNLHLNYQEQTFPSQYSTYHIEYNTTRFPQILTDIEHPHYFDVGSGLLLYSDQLWAGYSLYHINRPSTGFWENSGSNTSFLHTLLGGYRFKYNIGMRESLNDYNFHVIPTFLYKTQGPSDQLDLGVYLQYKDILMGTWYRGIPIKNYNNSIKNINNESIIFLMGLIFDSFSFAYSYDIVISKLYSSWGAHEIGIIYKFPPESQFISKHKKYKALPCPKMQKMIMKK